MSVTLAVLNDLLMQQKAEILQKVFWNFFLVMF